MYCRNCGSEMADNAVVCVKCGVAKGAAANYCPNCGAQTNPTAAVCISCGVALKNGNSSIGDGKQKLIAGLLALVLGFTGAHEIYLGNTKKAVPRIILAAVALVLRFIGKIMFLSGSTFKVLGTILLICLIVVGIVDAVKIFQGKVTDSNGNELK